MIRANLPEIKPFPHKFTLHRQTHMKTYEQTHTHVYTNLKLNIEQLQHDWSLMQI